MVHLFHIHSIHKPVWAAVLHVAAAATPLMLIWMVIGSLLALNEYDEDGEPCEKGPVEFWRENQDPQFLVTCTFLPFSFSNDSHITPDLGLWPC